MNDLVDLFTDTTVPPEVRVLQFLRSRYQTREACAAWAVALHCGITEDEAASILHGLSHCALPSACVTWQGPDDEPHYQFIDPRALCLAREWIGLAPAGL